MFRTVRRRADILAGLIAMVVEHLVAYTYNIMKEVRKGPQVTATIESKEIIRGNKRREDHEQS